MDYYFILLGDLIVVAMDHTGLAQTCSGGIYCSTFLEKNIVYHLECVWQWSWPTEKEIFHLFYFIPCFRPMIFYHRLRLLSS